MWAFLIVVLQIALQSRLHLGDGIEPGFTPLHPEVFIEEGTVKPLDEPVALRAANFGFSMFDVFELKEQLIRVMVRPSAELSTIVGENGLDLEFVLLKERDNIVVQHMNSGHWHLVGVEPPPGVAAVAVDHGLEVDSADSLERTDHKGVYRNEIPGKTGMDMPFPELRTRFFQHPDLFFAELDLLSLDFTFKSQESLVSVEQVVPAPDASDTSRTDLHSLNLGHTGTAVSGVIQAMLSDGLFHRLWDPVRMGAFGSRHAVQESLRSIGLVVPPGFIELLAAVSAELAGFGNVAEFFSTF